jgi:hypothetical protein
MQIPKDKIIELLRERGDQGKADQAGRELPDQVDPDQDAGLLAKYGVEPQDVVGKLGL